MGSSKAPGQGTATATATDWIWDPSQQLYYSPATQTYAYTHSATGQWIYLPSSTLGIVDRNQDIPAESSKSAELRALDRSGPFGGSGPTSIAEGKEEGEIEDDVGWGGLMEPEVLEQVMKTQAQTREALLESRKKALLGETAGSSSILGINGYPARYDDPSLYAYDPTRQKSPSPSAYASASISNDKGKDKEKETPNHILRMVVVSSPSLAEGMVGMVDTRQGGVQLGRDRCEKGGQARLRVKEMEVSKTHGVIYWGSQGGADEEDWANEGDAEEGWWVVDLGSTHGTFVTRHVDDENDIYGVIDLTNVDDKPVPQSIPRRATRARAHRLSEPKTSSLPYPLTHLCLLTLGQTTFQIHIHDSWPCDACQLGKGNEIPLDTGDTPDQRALSSQVDEPLAWDVAMDNKQRRDNREINRKKEMAALRDALVNRRGGGAESAKGPSGEPGAERGAEKEKYLDRSAMRRQLHPASPPRHLLTSTAGSRYPQKTPLDIGPSRSDTPPIQSQSQPPPGPSIFAQNMLVAQGWTPGSGLGKDLAGRSAPIDTKMRTEKRGLGAVGSLAVRDDLDANSGGEGDWRQRGKIRRYEAMKAGQGG